MNKNTQELWGIWGQYGSGLLVLTGLIIELLYQAHLGFVCITAGGLLWGVFTKLRGH